MSTRLDYSGVTSDVDLVGLWLVGRPESTTDKYAPVADAFLAYIAPKGLKDLTAEMALSWSETVEGADATRARVISTVKSLLTFAWRTGYTPVNVGRLLRCVKVRDTLHEKWIDEEQVKALVAGSAPGRDRALVRLLYTGGLRLSEALRLRWIDIGQGRVTVLGKGHKGRTLVVPSSVEAELRALRPEGARPQDRVFLSCRGKPLGERDAREVVYRAAAQTGIKLSPHWLRHAHSSHALDRGCPIHLLQKSLGHANVATTSRYLHARPDQGASQFLGEV